MLRISLRPSDSDINLSLVDLENFLTLQCFREGSFNTKSKRHLVIAAKKGSFVNQHFTIIN